MKIACILLFIHLFIFIFCAIWGFFCMIFFMYGTFISQDLVKHKYSLLHVNAIKIHVNAF